MTPVHGFAGPETDHFVDKSTSPDLRPQSSRLKIATPGTISVYKPKGPWIRRHYPDTKWWGPYLCELVFPIDKDSHIQAGLSSVSRCINRHQAHMKQVPWRPLTQRSCGLKGLGTTALWPSLSLGFSSTCWSFYFYSVGLRLPISRTETDFSHLTETETLQAARILHISKCLVSGRLRRSDLLWFLFWQSQFNLLRGLLFLPPCFLKLFSCKLNLIRSEVCAAALMLQTFLFLTAFNHLLYFNICLFLVCVG